MTVTKSKLVELVANSADITSAQATLCVDTILASIAEALFDGNKVELRGFGSFRVRQRAARVGRNPKTGVTVQVPVKRIPCFKPGLELRTTLLKGRD